MAYLNFTQRSTRKQEVEVKTLHHVMILQQGGCHRQHSCGRLPKCQRDLLHQRLRALPGHLQYLSWAPALTQEHLAEGPIRTPGNSMLPWSANHRHCNLVRDTHSRDLKVRHKVGAYFAASTDFEQEGTTSHS